MSTAITSYKEYQVNFRPVRLGGNEFEVPEGKKITKEQYNLLKTALTTSKFVEIGGELFSTNDIRSIEKLPAPKRDVPQRWQYDSDEEYSTALEVFNGE